MPTFLGTLELSEQQNVPIEEQGAALIAKRLLPVVPSKTGKRIVTDTAVVLENAAHGFIHPNILDVKLGVRLWADDAHPDKKKRFDLVTQETTHKDLGFRIAGMRVWQGEGATGPDIDQDGYRIYNKDYGRFSVNTSNVNEAFRNFIFAESAGIDEELGCLIAQAFLADVTRIQEVVEGQESRMFSASILFVFEGDGTALRRAMEEASNPCTNSNGHEAQRGVDAEESEGEDEEEDNSPKIYTVKVIDFAHAQWTPGMGPDENALVGIRSVARILKHLGNVK